MSLQDRGDQKGPEKSNENIRNEEEKRPQKIYEDLGKIETYTEEMHTFKKRITWA